MSASPSDSPLSLPTSTELPKAFIFSAGPKVSKSQDDECAICLSDRNPEWTVRLNPCKHQFDFGCLAPWVKRCDFLPGPNVTCPLCRQPVKFLSAEKDTPVRDVLPILRETLQSGPRTQEGFGTALNGIYAPFLSIMNSRQKVLMQELVGSVPNGRRVLVTANPLARQPNRQPAREGRPPSINPTPVAVASPLQRQGAVRGRSRVESVPALPRPSRNSMTQPPATVTNVNTLNGTRTGAQRQGALQIPHIPEVQLVGVTINSAVPANVAASSAAPLSAATANIAVPANATENSEVSLANATTNTTVLPTVTTTTNLETALNITLESDYSVRDVNPNVTSETMPTPQTVQPNPAIINRRQPSVPSYMRATASSQTRRQPGQASAPARTNTARASTRTNTLPASRSSTNRNQGHNQGRNHL